MSVKRSLCVLAAAAMPAFVAAAAGDEFDRGYALAQAKGCFECHALGTGYIGPSFSAIARRYRRDPEAGAKLPYVIRGGSVGHWGERYAMWPQQQLTDSEVKLLVDWILSQ